MRNKGGLNMNSDEKIEITKKREYLVVKGNDLIQNNRYELSLPEQKTVAFVCSMIKPINAIDRAKGIPFQLDYEFNIRDYCKVCGIDYDAGKNYADVKATLKRLRDRSMWLTLEDGSETTVAWLDRVTTNKKSGIAKIRIDDRIAPNLFDLGQRFTQYQLYNILAMRSSFSVRLYELLKSYLIKESTSKTFDIVALKKLLMVEDVKSYDNFKDFRKKVLEKAQEEINELTDINIYFEPITKGRKTVKVKFRIERKDPIQRMLAGATANDRLEQLK